VKQIIHTEGFTEYERRQLLKLGVRASNTPMAFGYEVTPLLLKDQSQLQENNESADYLTSDAKKETSVRFAVQLTSDKQDFVDDRESHGVILESDGKTTYCISEHGIEEEGLEVIGLGRFNTMEETESFEEDLTGTASQDSLEVDDKLSRIQDSLEVDDKLSRIFSSSDRIQVAFFRPTETDQTSKMKEE
jgi:hypothetical protein